MLNSVKFTLPFLDMPLYLNNKVANYVGNNNHLSFFRTVECLAQLSVYFRNAPSNEKNIIIYVTKEGVPRRYVA